MPTLGAANATADAQTHRAAHRPANPSAHFEPNAAYWTAIFAAFLSAHFAALRPANIAAHWPAIGSAKQTTYGTTHTPAHWPAVG
jgi:hypothetical protein